MNVRRIAERLAPWLAVGMVSLWAARPNPLWLMIGSLMVVAATRSRPGDRPRAFALVLLILALLVGFGSEGRDRAIARDFGAYWDERERTVFEILDRELQSLLDRGSRATLTLASEAATGNPPLHERVARVRRESRLTALALYDGDGRPVVWDGLHRGRVPERVSAGAVAFAFEDRPLVSYLYLTAPVEGGGTAVAAHLVRTDLPAGSAPDRDFATRMRERSGERIRVSTAERAHAGEVFDFTWEGDVLFSVSLERAGEAERRDQILAGGRVWAALLAVLAWLALGGGIGADPFARRAWCVTALVLGVLLPVRWIPGLDGISASADFLLPLPGGITLGRLSVILLAAAVVAGASRPWNWRGGRPLVAALGAALAFPGLAGLLAGSGSVAFLSGPETPWIVYTLVLTTGLALIAWVGLVVARRGGQRRLRVATGVAVALALSMVAGALAARGPGLHPAWLALWALPLVIARPAGPREGGGGGGLAWGLAVMLGATAAVPHAWGTRLVARMDLAEVQVGRLGTDVDPYLQFLLDRSATVLDSLDAEGAGPVELLYQGWRQGGLAEAGYPIHLSLRSPSGMLLEELRVGPTLPGRPTVEIEMAEAVTEGGGVTIRRFERPDAHYAMALPLSDGRVVIGVVPPLQGAASGATLLGPLFGSLDPTADDPLTVIPLLSGEEVARGDTVQWVRAGEGWQGELAVTYPSEPGGVATSYHAHYVIPLPGPMVAVARGSLLLALSLAYLGLLWLLGRVLADREGGWRTVFRHGFGSFRARVTVALFGFFLLSVVLFGSLAYRTIAGASQRAARVLAERLVDDAARAYNSEGGQIYLIARRVGSDLLEFRHGALREGSGEELVELGLYEGWVPFPVYEALAQRESLLEAATTALGSWEYVTAYRRIPDAFGDILGAPVPLQAGEAAVQSREVAHLLAFAVLAGAVLSLALALLVARTLTRPIQTLRVASERVGSGNLRVRLPGDRADEFGAVFEAFNRMVRRLRGARRDLVRTSRRTQAVVEEVATGVLAFDPEGVVTLVNPRARRLLDLSAEVGERLPQGDGVAGEFVRWIELYFRDGLLEATTELQDGERRIRIRARRIGGGGPPSGAVVSLEDVTDELRSERILAWGEMARQVAHEVKNPLTPIKLSVQHIRRAWDDRRSDFDQILTRNADAMLREIDRLAAIATGFSRFGAPDAAGEQPVGPVAPAALVDDVLALYRGGEGPIRFETDVPVDLPPVAGRTSEMKEVLVNLLENARAAIRESGTVRVEGARDGETVLLRVTDDGTGIPDAMLPRVFEPHFSTRSTGTGLGLAIVRRLVEGWGGVVAIASREGEGTVVTLRLRPWEGSAGGGTVGSIPST